MEFIYWLLLWAILSWAIGFGFYQYIDRKKTIEWKKIWENLINDSKKKSEEIVRQAEKESKTILDKANREALELTSKAEKIEERLMEKEEKIEKKLEDISSKQDLLFSREEELKTREEWIIKKQQELDWKLTEISKLTVQEARELLLKQVSEKYESDSLTQIEKYKKSLEDRKTEITREILIKSIQQYAWDVTSEVTTTLIPLPNDDVKWKLIWKEWRNIVAFERSTWVALIIDDTPDTVFISAFDLFKRYIAKKSLEKLLEDWRIQPARIEEIVEITTKEADILLKEVWKKTLDDLNLTWIPEEIISLIWKLRFRTSYWQNILKHSTEVAYIAESIARDLKLDPVLLKKWWLLHDIWKALDHDIEWTHPEIWARVWRKYWLDEKIVDMIENHHWEHSSISIEAAVVQMADAISSVRPWARRESIEQYVKRVKEMEALVQSFSWVSKAYAISAWREVRVFVDAETVSDLDAQETARNIALEIESKLNYPWEVKVNLIREMRVIQYAK